MKITPRDVLKNYVHIGGLEENMGMAVDEMIKREKARLRREGKITGKREGKIEVAKN